MILDYIGFASTFFPLISGIILFKYLPEILRKFVYFFLAVAITDTAASLLSINNMNNMPVSNIYAIFEATALLYLFNEMNKGIMFKKFFIIVGVFYFMVWIVDNLIINSIVEFNPVHQGIKFFLFIIVITRMLLYISGNIQINLLSNYQFWILIALLLYFSSTLFVYSTATMQLTKENKVAMQYTWWIHSIIMIITNCILSYSLICFYRKRNLYSL